MALIAAVATAASAGGFLIRYVYDKFASEPINQTPNIVISDSYDRVEMGTNIFIVIAVCLILTLLIVTLSVLLCKWYHTKTKKRYARNAANPELQL